MKFTKLSGLIFIIIVIAILLLIHTIMGKYLGNCKEGLSNSVWKQSWVGNTSLACNDPGYLKTAIFGAHVNDSDAQNLDECKTKCSDDPNCSSIAFYQVPKKDGSFEPWCVTNESKCTYPKRWDSGAQSYNLIREPTAPAASAAPPAALAASPAASTATTKCPPSFERGGYTGGGFTVPGDKKKGGCGWKGNVCPKNNCGGGPDGDDKYYCLKPKYNKDEIDKDWSECAESHGFSKDSYHNSYKTEILKGRAPKGCGWGQGGLAYMCPSGNYHGVNTTTNNVYCLKQDMYLADLNTNWLDCLQTSIGMKNHMKKHGFSKDSYHYSYKTALENNNIPKGCGWGQGGLAGMCPSGNYHGGPDNSGNVYCLNPIYKLTDYDKNWGNCVEAEIVPAAPTAKQPPIVAGAKQPPPQQPPPNNVNTIFPSTGLTSNEDNNSQYHTYDSNNVDPKSISKDHYEKIGRKFIKDESDSKGVRSPPILDYEAEVLGRMIWRLVNAEIAKSSSQSQDPTTKMIEQQTELIKMVSKIMKNNTDNHMGKKHQGLGSQASDVPDNGPRCHISNRTDNMFGCRPNNGNDVKIKKGYFFEGRPVSGLPRYYNKSSAIEHSFKDNRCGGINYDSITGEYTLMPKHARLIKKRNCMAFIKKEGSKNEPDKKKPKWMDVYNRNLSNGFPSNSVSSNSSYQPITGIGSPVNPNSSPRPYDSLMGLF